MKVCSVLGMREFNGIIEYQCLLTKGAKKWLKRNQIVNFYDVPNPYAEREKVTQQSIEKIAKETEEAYKFLLRNDDTQGVKAVVKRNGVIMYIYQHEEKKLEVLYTEEQKREHINELFQYFEEHVKIVDNNQK